MCNILYTNYACGHRSSPSMSHCSCASIHSEDEGSKKSGVTYGFKELGAICRRSLQKNVRIQESTQDCAKCVAAEAEQRLGRLNRRSRAFVAFEFSKQWNENGGKLDAAASKKDENADMAGKGAVAPAAGAGKPAARGKNGIIEVAPDGRRIWQGYDPNGPRDEDWIHWGFAK